MTVENIKAWLNKEAFYWRGSLAQGIQFGAGEGSGTA
jgi:hypothetical protein